MTTPGTDGEPRGWLAVWRQKQAEAKERIADRKAQSPMAQLVCPHCQTRGAVKTSRVKARRINFGLSPLAPGLARKGWVTRARCSNCKTTWDMA